MRILMLSHGYPPTVSGVTLVVQKIARSMVRKGHAVTVVAASDQGEPYDDQDRGVRLIRVRSMPNPFWKEGPLPLLGQKELDEVAADFQPDILHSHEAALTARQCLRLGEEANLPVVSTCYYVPRFVARYLTWGDEPQALVEKITWGYSIRLFNQFDHVVFATIAHRDMFLAHGLEVPTTIISNGLDTTHYCPSAESPDEVEARLGLPPKPRILFVSRLARDKEIDILIRAMTVILSEREAHLLLVGRGDDRPRLEELVEDLGLQQAVHFLGFVPEDDMPALYRASDLFAIASICEVQSLPTLQAAATGLPLVVADAVALPELVNDGVNGFLVAPGDVEGMAGAILRILGDPDLAARMGQASLGIAEPHAENHTFDLYEQLYEQMLAGGRLLTERSYYPLTWGEELPLPIARSWDLHSFDPEAAILHGYPRFL